MTGPAHSRPMSTAPRTRDRSATEERILGAVGDVLARDGFSGIGVNAIAKQASVDKVLIYRYFGGLPELLQAWGGSGRFWPRVQDLLGDDPQALLALPLAERYTRFFEHFISELRRRPLTLAILAAEVQDHNELTVILEAEREQWGDDAVRVLGGPALKTRPWVQDLTLLLVAGVQYLLLRSRNVRMFSGVDIQSDAGWQRLLSAVRTLATLLFDVPQTVAAARPTERPTKRPTKRPAGSTPSTRPATVRRQP